MQAVLQIYLFCLDGASIVPHIAQLEGCAHTFTPLCSDSILSINPECLLRVFA